MKYCGIVFFLSFSLPLSLPLPSVFVGFGIRVMLIENKLRSASLSFLEEMTQNWCSFFFKRLVKHQ